MKSQAECPCCGSEDVFGVTRVVGYFAIIENMNDSKRAEINDRKIGDYSVQNSAPAKPLFFDLGNDGVYLIGKEECTICVSEKEIIRQALNEAGIEGSIEIIEKKLADKYGIKIANNVSFAVKANVDLNRIPAVVAIKDKKVKYIGYLGDSDNPLTIETLITNFKNIYGEMSLITV